MNASVAGVSEASLLMRCLLCDSSHGIVPADFRQWYAQGGGPPVVVDWWECRACEGWFAYPVPGPRVIARYWETVGWADPRQEQKIADNKKVLFGKVLKGLRNWTEPGPLLDVGCNFGQFMLMAHEARWVPAGFDPSPIAAEKARAKGFDVRCGWELGKAGFAEASFAAITSVDVFYYAWHPIATLRDFYKLLRPGGVLAMRVSNKRFALGLVRAFSQRGAARDATLSKLLQGQFHTINMLSLSRILREIGFDHVRIEPSAAAAPWSASGWTTRGAYLCADITYFLSLTMINLSPAVLVFARKAIVQ